jgi:hypothetical protein
MASRSRCQDWNLGARNKPAGAGRWPVRWSDVLAGVLADLPTVGRLETSGEQPSEESSPVVPLAVAELFPEGRDQCGRVLSTHGRGGAAEDVGLGMMFLLEGHRVGGTTGPTPAEPRRRF